MHRTVTDWQTLGEAFAGKLNFLMEGDCVPFAFNFPPLEEIIEEMRHDELSRISTGEITDKLILEDARESFMKKSIDEIMQSTFALAHFRLSVFDKPDGFLHGFKEQVLDPWEAGLREAGFTWDRCYPIAFISGKKSATNYHMDISHVVAWQTHGVKHFCGLKDPEQFAPRESRVTYKAGEHSKPMSVSEEDALCYEMKPGDVLWNTLLTPHWVETGDAPAMSINLSHGGLRYKGNLSPHEQELIDFREKYPRIAPGNFKAHY